MPWKYIGIGLAVLALIAAIVFGVRGCKKDEYNQENQSINLGVQSERGATNGEVLSHVQKADDAVTHATDADRGKLCDEFDRNCPSRHK